MNCPHCNTKLLATQYEKVRVQVCTSCGGHYVESQKLENIKRRKDKSAKDLLDEIANAPVASTTNSRVRCPRCRGPMQPEKRDSVAMDCCTQCAAWWLDAGELAQYQLYFEISDVGLEARSFQHRLENMTDAERLAYEAMLQKLKWPTFLTGEDIRGLTYLFQGLLP